MTSNVGSEYINKWSDRFGKSSEETTGNLKEKVLRV